MQSFLNLFVENIDHGKCDTTEQILNEESDGFIKGYFKARGMVEYFQEQEIFLSEKFSQNDQPTRKLEGNEMKYSSRNVYTFVPIPSSDYSNFDYDVESSISYIDTFPLVFDKFNECLLKIYDFTTDLSECVNSLETKSREILSNNVKSSRSLSCFHIQAAINDIKINELIEVLSVVEIQEISDSESGFGMVWHLDNSELNTHKGNMKRRLVLHVVSFKRISNFSPVICPEICFNGYLGEFNSPLKTSELLQKMVEYKCPDLKDISSLYSAMVEYVSNELCYGNRLLSEYILMSICHRRKLDLDTEIEGVTNPPQVVLHISMCNKEFSKRLYSFFQSHLPRMFWIGADVSNLNNSDITPYFDVESDKFVTGALQIPLLRNLIVVDETSLEEGQLSAKGIENISNLSSLTNFGYVNYNFTNYQVPIRTESNYIILTTGEKSVFSGQSDIKIPLEICDNNTISDLKLTHETNALSQYETYISSNLRLYLSIVGSCVESFEFDEQTKDFIAETFVNIRQKPSFAKLIHPSTLHIWIMLSRTQALMND
ncbi:MCM7 domain-containing protein [Cryptosporidium canis]|uniref:MCM7 domain-containing protein n=1 Tax=Cryptosporidium canis TaxID=195482 RepID=A0A9D5HZV5_9CRYT|nr:MCM7 domain-containing protein [Cryptosporidium canis]